MASLTDVFVDVLPNTEKFEPDLKKKLRRIDASKPGKAAGKSYGTGFSTAAKGIAAGIGALFVVDKVRDFFTSANAEAREAQKVGALTANVIKSTGGAANVTAAQVESLATALSNKAGIDDELIQSGANLLLTFKNVRNEVGKGNAIFDRATAAAIDLSAAGFGDVTSASKQLGKALNDPIAGIAALSRSGVTFTKAQKDQIKALVESGDALSAQKIILKEVESQVGGAAAATATSGEKMSVTWGNLKETVGKLLLPVLDRLFGAMATGAAWLDAKGVPAFLEFAGTVKQKVGPALSSIGEFIRSTVIPAIRDLAGWVADNILPRLTELGGWLQNTGIPALRDFASWLQKNQGWLLPIAVGIGAIVAALKIYSATILVVSAVTKAWAAVQAAMNIVLAANPIGLVVLALVGLVAGLVFAWKNSETFRDVVTGVFNAVWNAIKAVWDWIKSNWPLLLAILTGPIGLAVLAIIRNWDTLKAGLAAGWAYIRNNAINPLVAGFQSVWNKAVAIKDGVVGAFTSMGGAISSAFSTILGKITGPVTSVLKWIDKNMIGNLNKVTSKFGLTIPTILGGGGTAANRGRRGGGGNFNAGGLIPGGGPDRDSVHAYLTPGEGVVKRSRMREIAASMGMSPKAAIEAINRGGFGNGKGGAFDFIGDIASGVSGAISSIGSQVNGWLRQGAAFAIDKVMTPIVSGVGHVVPGPEFVQKAIKGMLGKAKDSMVSWARGKDKESEGTAPNLSGTPSRSGSFFFPLPKGSYRVGQGPGGHGYQAQDFPAPTGTPVFAPFAGQMIGRYIGNRSYGRYATVTAGALRFLVAHLSALVGGNRMVRAGELIGRVGSVGNSTGPHAHVEFSQNGVGQNPRNYLRYDSGGYLPPGLLNRTGKPEPVLTDQQWTAVKGLAAQGAVGAGRGGDYNVHVYSTTEDQLNRIRQHERYARLAYAYPEE